MNVVTSLSLAIARLTQDRFFGAIETHSYTTIIFMFLGTTHGLLKFSKNFKVN
jgi:hypothetical protein